MAAPRDLAILDLREIFKLYKLFQYYQEYWNSYERFSVLNLEVPKTEPAGSVFGNTEAGGFEELPEGIKGRRFSTPRLQINFLIPKGIPKFIRRG